MSEAENPYAAPTATQPLSDANDFQEPITPAGQGARLANLILDYLAQSAIGFVVGIAVVVIGGERGAEFLEETPGFVIGLPIFLAYYFGFEALTSRTLGKLVTGTMVVNEKGQTPTMGQIAGRTLCRLIPFEAFSFFGTPPRGWHDRIPKTFVVKIR